MKEDDEDEESGDILLWEMAVMKKGDEGDHDESDGKKYGGCMEAT